MSKKDAAPRPPRTRTRTAKRRRVPAIAVAVSLVVVLGGGAAVWAILTKQAGGSDTPATPPVLVEEVSVPDIPPLEMSLMLEPDYDIDSPSSITVVVNKQRPMNPIDWAPGDLVLPDIPNVWGQPIRAEAADALQQMYAASIDAGVPFTITSAYRDYWEQKSIYDGLVAEGGVEYADRDTARPGYSEHQTGLTVDLYGEEGCQLQECFGETPTGIWLRENAYRFGYILRYNDGEQATVGYIYEPWHFRYVGVDVATAMHEQGVLNLEDFFGLPPAPTN